MSIFKSIESGFNKTVKATTKVANQAVNQTTKVANQSANQVAKVANQTVNRIDSTVNALIHGRNGYGPDIQRFVNRYGNAIITHVQLVRNPIAGVLQSALNIASQGEVEKLPYDRLFHLSMNLTTSMGNISVQKNEFIAMSNKKEIVTNDGKSMDLNNAPNISFNDFLENGRKQVGDQKYYNYNVVSANCQFFINALLKGNGLNTPESEAFVMQDASSVWKGKTNTRKFANSVVDLGKYANIIKSGGSIFTPL